MLPASCTAGGQCLGAPDTCKTPSPPFGDPKPIPYPNMAMLMTATNTEAKVLIGKRDAVTQSSKMPRSNGDEPGVAGGVASGTFGDGVEYVMTSSKVFAGGKKLATLTCATKQNGNNIAGLQAVPSQVQVLASM